MNRTENAQEIWKQINPDINLLMTYVSEYNRGNTRSLVNYVSINREKAPSLESPGKEVFFYLKRCVDMGVSWCKFSWKQARCLTISFYNLGSKISVTYKNNPPF